MVALWFRLLADLAEKWGLPFGKRTGHELVQQTTPAEQTVLLRNEAVFGQVPGAAALRGRMTP